MNTMKRLLAMVLVLAMALSLAACGAPAKKDALQNTQQEDTLFREDKELIAELIGGQEDASDLTDEALDALVQELVGNSEKETATSDIINLSAGQKQEQPAVDVTENKDAYDENGAMTKPFDQVYPELIEKEEVAFSGESILIKMASDKLTDGLKAAGIGALEEIVPMEKEAWYEAKLVEGTDAKKALEAVRKLDEVLLAEYNYEIQVAALDDYKHFDKDKGEDFKKNGHNKDQWHFHHCGIVDGYEEMEKDGGDSSVVVAVIDSGVDYEHEDLKDNIWVNTKEIPDNGYDDDGNGYVDDYYGVDIVAGVGNGGDTNGHGTHVAGIIAARNNNVGVLGIAYNVKIMSVKAAMHNGMLNQADIAKAVLYAYNNGAEVINMSFGGSACSIAVQDALATAYTRCVLVASAGNSGENNEPTDKDPIAVPNYPAALTYVLGVMSVDETGRESVFTNWDVFSFNGVEYELYAPGENIMSTLPGNKYGFLSGTSMAAPVVSAFAAILRSEFTDRDMYPTKFIYGQLASTSEIYADCVNPQDHAVFGMPHNLPQITDLNAALTKLPKPEVNLQDYALFDDPKYSDKNNGDGVIDAGETIALGLTLRNRWGMSENTIVTIDTISKTSGLADPYFTIQNPTVNYGSVGTYSTQDCGKVYTDELFTGWENPFLIQVSEDCPNDYRFTLNVSITCENALDEEDTAVYTSGGKVTEKVRAGYILPSIIDEDMVLTPENLYIIPNATVITEGTTVRVEPGTHIQFWSDDADDPYTDSYIAYLLVNGNFLVEGTKENPVYIYPSQLMSHYGVEIGSSAKGYVSLKYADITNFFYKTAYTADHTGTGNHIDLADHCTFRNNYLGDPYARYLEDGIVKELLWSDICIGHINAKDCVFYKLAFSSDTYLAGSFDRCIFNQCGIEYRMYADCSYTRCVFLSNAAVSQTDNNMYYKSTMQVSDRNLVPERIRNIYYRPETGTTYVSFYDDGVPYNGISFAMWLKEAFGGGFLKVETDDEKQWLAAKEVYGQVGAKWNDLQNRYEWSDGTPIDLALFPNMATRLGPGDYAIRFSSVDNGTLIYGYVAEGVYEIPGQILPTDITFQEYTVNMDLESTYQLSPINAPVQLQTKDFYYESADEKVVTVSDTGLVTPVGLGATDVWVWSQDKAVRNRVTITVKEYVPLEGLTLQTPAAELAIGENMALNCAVNPVDTTRNHVTYTSSDEKVAKVDAGGIVTGVSSGKVTITAACEGFTDQVELTVYKKAASLQMESIALSAVLEDGTVELPQVVTDAGAETVLSWRSTDKSVAALEDGKLALKGLGTTSVIVTDSRSGLSATCLVIVSQEKSNPVRQLACGGTSYENRWVLLENGEVYMWNQSYVKTPTYVTSGVKQIVADDHYAVFLKEDGTVQLWNAHQNIAYLRTYEEFTGWDITDIELRQDNNIWVCTADGSAYAMGNLNSYGQLGIGSTQNVSVPTLINIDGVVDIENKDTGTYLLTDKGELYAAGNLDYTSTAEPILLANDVAQILEVDTNYYCMYLTKTGTVKMFDGNYGESYTHHTYGYDTTDMDQVVCTDYYNKYFIGIRDGKVYTGSSNGKLSQVVGICDAVAISAKSGTYYVGTASGVLLAFGNNPVGHNYMAGVAIQTNVTTPVMIPLVPVVEEVLTQPESNLTEGVLAEDALMLTFNKHLQSASPKLYADGTQITLHCELKDYNHLQITRSSGFAENVNYTLVFEPGTVNASGGITNEEALEISFTYTPGEKKSPETETQPEKVVYEAIVDTSVERVLTVESLNAKLSAYVEKTQRDPQFAGNAILNPVSTDTDVSHWLRLQAPSVAVGDYVEIPLGGNWWGSTNDRAIGLQMIDYADFPNYSRFMYAPYLTEAPEDTFPFVTSVKLFNKYGEEVTTVGNEQIRFQVKFNRDMDTSIPLLVRFGSAYPYGDYEIEGQYVDARTWEGVYTLNTLIENGYQYFTISNGCSATDDLPLQLDQYRFSFEIDTTAAQALVMQGTATDTGIRLTWTQDDFKTLMGYNVYRSTKEDGYYTRLNSTVISADTMEWFDDTVEPGVVYYYNFTVVQTDLSESEPSGKIVIMSKDTMAPSIYHSPIANAFTGANLVLDATVTDNLNIAYANLYYRVVGTDTWNTIRMNKLNDKYSAIIPASYITLDGIEYYIEAFDGVSYTYKGSADAPYTVAVQEAIGADALGDVDGDGVITNLDALLLLYTINDKYNMTAAEFARADLNGDGELWAAEALRILQYVSGVVGSVKM